MPTVSQANLVVDWDSTSVVRRSRRGIRDVQPRIQPTRLDTLGTSRSLVLHCSKLGSAHHTTGCFVTFPDFLVALFRRLAKLEPNSTLGVRLRVPHIGSRFRLVNIHGLAPEQLSYPLFRTLGRSTGFWIRMRVESSLLSASILTKWHGQFFLNSPPEQRGDIPVFAGVDRYNRWTKTLMCCISSRIWPSSRELKDK